VLLQQAQAGSLMLAMSCMCSPPTVCSAFGVPSLSCHPQLGSKISLLLVHVFDRVMMLVVHPLS
jgi:hypothetical protein